MKSGYWERLSLVLICICLFAYLNGPASFPPSSRPPLDNTARRRAISQPDLTRGKTAQMNSALTC